VSFDVFAPDPSPPTGSDRRAQVETEARRRVTRRRNALAVGAVLAVLVAAVPLIAKVTAKDTDVLAGGDDTKAVTVAALEIGRASCRERE